MMRYFLIKIKYLFFFPTLFLFVGLVLGYDNIITHPQITDVAIKIYQNKTGENLTSEQAQWIIKGSVDEDADPRYLNHYYDPTTGKGLDDFDERFQRNFTGMSAKEWAKTQSGVISHSGDYSESTILKNYRDENYKRAYQGIGHILHLIQDMSVPAHTRNDSHAEGDPYENWAKQNGKINLGESGFVSVDNLDQAFDELALFSHNNFFSKSTVNIDGHNNYKKVRKFEDGIDVEYLINNINGQDYYLAYSENSKAVNPTYTVKNNKIHYDYWQILHPRAVGYSAGVIDYFIKQFEQIDAEKQAQQDSGLLASIWNKTKTTFSNLDNNAMYIWGDIFMPARGALEDTWDFVGESYRDIKNEIFPKIGNPQSNIANIGQQLENLNQDAVQKNQTIEGQMTLADEGQASGFDNDVIIGPQVQQGQQPQEIRQSQPQPQNQSQPEIIHAPFYRAPEVIHAPYQGRQEIAVGIPNDNTPSQTFIFTGGGPDNQSGQEQDLDDKTVQDDDNTDEDNQDQNQDNLPDPNNEPDEQPKQEEPKQDEPKQEDPQPQPDPGPILPDINFYLTEYDVRKPNFILNWEDRNNVAQRWELEYKLGPNFNWASIALANSSELIANSYMFTAEYDDLTYYFRVRAQYDGSNFSDWVELPVDISSKPVVINEIAWMGTQASHNDEWIELANKTDQEINLADWVLKISNGNSVSDVNLTGKIAPNGFYLLERTNDSTIPNISADQIFTGAISNNEGAWIELDDANNVLIDNAYIVSAGENGSKKTSERVSIWTAGINKNNWKTYSGQGGVARDADGNAILGTPRSRNSVADEFLALNASPDKSRIFLKSRGTILIENGIQIPAGVEMLIEPGSVLKFGYQGSLTVLGELVAKGTAEENIVFTSTSDDMYGADINGDDPIITSWMGVNFLESSKGRLDNVILRYVGSAFIFNAVYVNKADVKISNSIFENNSENVLVFDYANADISSSEFRNNIGHAVSVAYASANISSSIFKDNTGAGLWFGGSDGDVSISSSSFTGNKVPVETNRLTDFSMTGNTMSNNASNGILVYGGVAEDKSSITISADMPFVFVNSGSVDEGKTLNLSPGTVFKFEQRFFNVYGSLNAIGTSEQLVVFTSLNDDVYGGDANNDGDATMPGASSWYGIHFMDGENSILDNVIVKYAGLGSSGVYVEPEVGNFILSNSTISDSVIGATIASDGATIENVIVSNNSEIGLNVAANNATVSDATFQSNGKAFQSSSAYMDTILLSNLIFNGNANNYFIDGNTYDAWPEDLTVPLP